MIYKCLVMSNYTYEKVTAAMFSIVSEQLKHQLPAAYMDSVDTYKPHDTVSGYLLDDCNLYLLYNESGRRCGCYGVTPCGELFSCINLSNCIDMAAIIRSDKSITCCYSMNNAALVAFYHKCGFYPLCSLQWNENCKPQLYDTERYGRMPLLGWCRVNNAVQPFSDYLMVALYDECFNDYDTFHTILEMRAAAYSK